jgi:hypothetical protein
MEEQSDDDIFGDFEEGRKANKAKGTSSNQNVNFSF